MKIAFFGDGTLDRNKRLRDGSVAWRREMFQRLEADGHEPIYLAPPKRSAEAEPFYRDKVVGWDWRGNLDAVVFETRRPFFPRNNLADDAYYQQGRLIQDWWAGQLGDECAVLAIDFDLATRSAFGIGGRTAEYQCVKKYANLLPDLGIPLAAFCNRLTVLAPYTVERSPLHLQRDANYGAVEFTWGYPETLEAESRPIAERKWDLFYPGSDYGRRDKFLAYYGEAAKAGRNVGIGGIWKDTSAGTYNLPAFKRKGFKTHVQSECGSSLTFLNDGKHLLTQQALVEELRDTKVVVQIMRADCRDIGYDTMRPGEATAAGALCFVDSAISSPGGDVPHEWFRVSSFEELHDKLESVRGREEKGVEMWRSFLRERGTIADGAKKLAALIKSDEMSSAP